MLWSTAKWGTVRHFGKDGYPLSCKELDEKIDTISVH